MPLLRSIETFALAVGLLALALSATGCNKEQPAAVPAVGDTAPPPPAVPPDTMVAAAPADVAAPAPTVSDTTPASDLGNGADRPQDTVVAPADTPEPSERVRLSSAYVELYCAQRRGETARLRAIYRRHGFSDPKVWDAALKRATEDHEWLADITQRAIAACP